MAKMTFDLTGQMLETIIRDIDSNISLLERVVLSISRDIENVSDDKKNKDYLVRLN